MRCGFDLRDEFAAAPVRVVAVCQVNSFYLKSKLECSTDCNSKQIIYSNSFRISFQLDSEFCRKTVFVVRSTKTPLDIRAPKLYRLSFCRKRPMQREATLTLSTARPTTTATRRKQLLTRRVKCRSNCCASSTMICAWIRAPSTTLRRTALAL